MKSIIILFTIFCLSACNVSTEKESQITSSKIKADISSSKAETYHLGDSAKLNIQMELMKSDFSEGNAAKLAIDIIAKIDPHFNGFLWKNFKTLYLATDYNWSDGPIINAIQEDVESGHVEAIFYPDNDVNPLSGRVLRIHLNTHAEIEGKDKSKKNIYMTIVIKNDHNNHTEPIIHKDIMVGYVMYNTPILHLSH